MSPRRQFLRSITLSAVAAALPRGLAASHSQCASFFLVADTHYRADESDFSRMDDTSAAYNRRLIEWLNKLPGTEIPAAAGGGIVTAPHGVIHAGDLVDNADKSGEKLKMADTEMAAFTGDWGLNGGDALLRWPVREVHGNHDGPRGETVVTDTIKERNKRRAGLANVSENGLHYSWDWAGVHFVALGIVVGDAPEVTRQRRYAPHGSLPFLVRDLEDNVGKSGRPVVLVHHVDVARYSAPVADNIVVRNEWDYGDVHAYHAALKPYRVAASLCGHTHARNLFRWDGTNDTRAAKGSPFLNTDNGAHFNSPTQAFLLIEVAPDSVRVREFATKDGWQSGAWTPQEWKFGI